MTNIKDSIKSRGIHYFYRIDNLKNGKFYYGIRTCYCLPGQDPYMGSGTHLHNAFRFYGIENFKKTILRISPTRQDVSDLERWIVTEELVKDPMCYNERVGGDIDSFYGRVSCIDTLTGSNVMISKDLYYNNKDRYKHHRATAGKVVALINATGKIESITTEEFYSNKDKYTSMLSLASKGTSIYHNIKTGKNERMYPNDPRIGITAFNVGLGRKVSDKTKQKISKANKKMTGENNSMYGVHLVWINNGKSRKRVKPEEVQSYLDTGNWIKGTNLDNFYKSDVSENATLKKDKKNGHTSGFIHVTNGVDSKLIHPDKFPEYEAKGYRRGMIKRLPSVYNPNSGYQKGSKWMTDLDGKRRFVRLGDIEMRLNEGWSFLYQS